MKGENTILSNDLKLHVDEIKLKVMLTIDIPVNKMMETESKFIDSFLAKDEKWEKFHHENKFKLYTFSGFYPLEKDGVYKKGKQYTITIRTVNDSLALYFSTCRHANSCMNVVDTSSRIIPRKKIEKIYTLTPAVIKTEDGYWRRNTGLDDFERRIFENAVKKYNGYMGAKIDEEFQLYTNIIFLNKKPISTKYKNIHLIGDKVELVIADDEKAQELAYFLIGTGIGENCSRGFGFCNYKWI